MLIRDLIPAVSELIPYGYEEIRNAEYEKLITSFLTPGQSSPAPKLIHMLGIPGAGKTTFYNSRHWEPHVFIGFDTIMENLPAYQQDCAVLGAAKSFAKWELPARVIGYELLRRAIEKKYNIFFDHGALNHAHLDLLRNLRQQGWLIEMHYIKCDLETAICRAAQREKETSRHTPRQIIEERYRLLQSLQAEYRKTADAFYEYNNSTDRNILKQKAA